MKRIMTILLLILLLSGCGARKAATVDLMPNADPETSALGLYVYDGETITRRHLFQTDQYRADVMQAFHYAEAQEAAVDVTELQPPFYGIEMGAGDFGTACGLWSDGYFIAQNGKTYAFNYDFEALLNDHPWDQPDTFQSLDIMPCANLIAKTAKGWNTAFLTAAEEPVPPSGIAMTAQFEADTVQVEFENLSSEEWGYGYDYGLEVLLHDTWYYVPAEREMSFISLLCLLQPGGTAQESYSLAPYGVLPSGTYRFVTQGMAAEFAIE